MNRDFSSAMLPSAEAAARLDVQPARVRAMIRDGTLAAQKLGGRWFVDAASVERRRAIPSLNGRPFEPANAWALIQLWHSGEADWVNRWERSRLKRQLRLRRIDTLAPALRGRAELSLLKAHPAALQRLLASDDLRLGGASAAPIHGVDIVASDEVEAYVGADKAEKLINELHLEPSTDPNVLLHVVDGPWPFTSSAVGSPQVVAPLCVALDLLEAPDARSRRAGHALLERLIAERKSDEDVSPHEAQ